MVGGIEPLSLKLAQILGDDTLVAQTPAAPPTPAAAPAESPYFKTSPFEDILGKAIDALEGISQSETYANQLIDKYVRGQADLQDVMTTTSKLNILVQLAVTTVNTAVNTFKEITQMQV